jgi:hypothetical protein
MQFWWIHAPDYESDYQSSYINGSLEHPFGLPGVKCDVCKQTWGSRRRLSLECPPSLRQRKELCNGWPISLEQHQALQQEVQNEFIKNGISCPPLEPGDDFQPSYLDVPSKPKADFLWGCGIVVSKRIKELFETLSNGSVVFCPVILRKIGKRNAKLPVPIPSTGEPEDIIEEITLLADTNSVGPYFELLVQTKSAYAPGTEPLSVCSGCGRKTFPETDKLFEMRESMWNGKDIFSVHGLINVTDKLKLALQKMKATNIQFQIFEAFS